MQSFNPIAGVRNQLFILIFIAIGLNINTLFHEYALDDIVVLTENSFVAKGIKGIPEIITTDYVSGYSAKKNILTSPRYRPVSLILFALEYQFLGANPFISHLINILIFALLVTLLYLLLKRYLFQNRSDNLVFIICLLFTVHPIHTEVIANVKSRDEIITFILLITSLISFFEYNLKMKPWILVCALFCFFLALLTKESAVTFLGIVPLVLFFFFNNSFGKSLRKAVPFLLVFIGYMLLRYLIVGFNQYTVNDVTNNPYLFATTTEAFATKVFIMLKYLWLLIFPYHLSSDYGYNQVPYINLFSAQFILSFILMLGLLVFALKKIKSRSLLSFCILYFFFTISVGTNFIVDLGTTMAERMLFIPSLAFCIVIAILFSEALKMSKILSTSVFLVILLLFSLKTVARNADWKNNETLFLADVNTSPNCARLNLYACERYIIKSTGQNNAKLKMEYLDKAVYYGEKSLKIYSEYSYTYLRLGIAYYYKQDYFKAADLLLMARKLEPLDDDTNKWINYLSMFFYEGGNGYYERNNIDEAIRCFMKSTELNPKNTEAWYNLGLIYYAKNDSVRAGEYWKIVKNLDPYHQFNKNDQVAH